MATDSVDRWPGYIKDPIAKLAIEQVGTAVADVFCDDERGDALTDSNSKLQRYQEYVEQTIAERVADFIGDGLDIDTFDEWIENGAINALLSEPSGEAPDLRVIA